MDYANDLLASLRERVSPVSPPPSWVELRARLTAAHAAAAELFRDSAAGAGPRGGFSEWLRPGSVANASRPVNRTDLADGKSDGSNAAVTAGQSAPGGRGQ